MAKNRKVKVTDSNSYSQKLRLDELAQSLSNEKWKPVHLNNKQPSTTLWVATVEVEVSQLKGTRTITIARECFLFF